MEIVEVMVVCWFDEKCNWMFYVFLLVQMNCEMDVFEVNKIMYINGMLIESVEIEWVLQYYFYFEYFYCGVVIFECEMNVGCVDCDQGNFQLFVNMWCQVCEWEWVILVLCQLV